MSDPSTPPPLALKLGKQPVKHDPRTIQLADYIDDRRSVWDWLRSEFGDVGGLLARRHHRHRPPKPPGPNPPPAPPPNPGPSTPPSSLNESSQIADWPVFGNDKYGDCVWAAFAHIIEVTSKIGGGAELSVSDGDVLDAYSAQTGFNPADPSTDNGTIMLDALNWWRHNPIAGQTLQGYAQFNPKTLLEWELANWLFGACDVGIAMPLSAQAQSQPGGTWSVVSTSGAGKPGSWGGHSVPFVDYGPAGAGAPTWGFLMQATPGFLGTYVDEAYALLLSDWFDKASAKSPAGFDLAALQADLAQFH